MADEPEVIKQDIEETATDLKSKVEKLEEKVLGTVQGTTEAVSGTVEAVKDTVQETIQTVRETVQETVQTVKRTFDLRYQVDRHPWLMLTGSVVAGFATAKVVGPWLFPADGYRLDGRYRYTPAASYATGTSETVRSRPAAQAAAPPPRESSGPSVVSRLVGNLEPEIHKVKEMAIGALFGFLRDMAKQALPQSLSGKVDEVMNSVTTKLGGEPVRGPVTQAYAGSGSSYR
jgi:hypothetical protein